MTGGVALAGRVGIVVGKAVNVGEGSGEAVVVAVGEAGVVGVGDCLPGGVLVGLARDGLADRQSGAVAWVFVIPSLALTNENRSNARENAVTIARERAG